MYRYISSNVFEGNHDKWIHSSSLVAKNDRLYAIYLDIRTFSLLYPRQGQDTSYIRLDTTLSYIGSPTERIQNYGTEEVCIFWDDHFSVHEPKTKDIYRLFPVDQS